MARLLIFLIASGLVIAALTPTAALGLPTNATASPYGDGWKCNRGYKKDFDANLCVKVVIPENAALDITGANWTCKRGFHKDAIWTGCEPVIIPENATLDITGQNWTCKRGYRKNPSFSGCLAVVIPANAVLDITGHHWTCKKGFKRNLATSRCDKVVIPENAQLNFLGNGWQCVSGFKKASNLCVKMTEAEVDAQRALKARIEAELEKRRQNALAGGDCETEYKTNAEVCVSITDGNIDCNESYAGEYFDDCDAEISYTVATNYEGGAYLDVNVECEIEIEYVGGIYGFSSSESDRDNSSHSLYAFGSDNERLSFNVSFYSFDKVTSAKISEAECEITSVYLW